MIQAWLAGKIGAKAAGLLLNKWTAILLIVGALGFSTWWYRDSVIDLEAENATLTHNVGVLESKIEKMKENEKTLRDDYNTQLALVKKLRDLYDNTRSEYEETRQELEKLQTYLEGLPKILNSIPDQATRNRVLKEANQRVQKQIDKSIGCIEKASAGLPCGEEQ